MLVVVFQISIVYFRNTQVQMKPLPLCKFRRHSWVCDNLSNSNLIDVMADLGVFQQKDVRCHTSAVTTKCLDDNLSPNPLGLSFIENFSSMPSLNIFNDPESMKVDQLKPSNVAFNEVWDRRSCDTSVSLLQTMPDWVSAVSYVVLCRKDILCADGLRLCQI